MKEQCGKYGLPYYETAKDREQVIQRFLRDFRLIESGSPETSGLEDIEVYGGKA